MRTLVSAPPPSPVEPVTETLHGTEVTDPYRWLEDQNSPRPAKFLAELQTLTKAMRSRTAMVVSHFKASNAVLDVLGLQTLSRKNSGCEVRLFCGCGGAILHEFMHANNCCAVLKGVHIACSRRQLKILVPTSPTAIFVLKKITWRERHVFRCDETSAY